MRVCWDIQGRISHRQVAVGARSPGRVWLKGPQRVIGCSPGGLRRSRKEDVKRVGENWAKRWVLT